MTTGYDQQFVIEAMAHRNSWFTYEKLSDFP